MKNTDMETDCVIICREVDKSNGMITSYKCKEGTYKDLSKDFEMLIFRSMFNQELNYFICSKDNLKAALLEIKKPILSVVKYCVEIKR